MTEKEETNWISKMVHGTILHIARNRSKINMLESILKEKKIIDSDELEKTWDVFYKKDLPKVFEEIEKNFGYKNMKLTFEKNGSIHISGLPKEKKENKMNYERNEKEIAYLAIVKSLEKALNDCQQFDDLKIFPGNEIKNLLEKVADKMIQENITVNKE